MAVAYLASDGKTRLSLMGWKEAQNDHNQRFLRQYDNGIINVEVQWVGKVMNYGDVYPEFYKVVRLDVLNYTVEGSKAPDPVMSDQWYPNEKLAIKAYEDFIMQWSASNRDSTGKFIEEDNALTPPPPPNPDAPTTEVNDAIIGDCAW
jgi:hypothetical protein